MVLWEVGSTPAHWAKGFVGHDEAIAPDATEKSVSIVVEGGGRQDVCVRSRRAWKCGGADVGVPPVHTGASSRKVHNGSANGSPDAPERSGWAWGNEAVVEACLEV